MRTEERILNISNETEKLIRKMEELCTIERSSFWEERTEVLRALSIFMSEAIQIYHDTDKQIEDVVNHEKIIWPKTEFGTNHFHQLTELDHLIHPEKHRK